MIKRLIFICITIVYISCNSTKVENITIFNDKDLITRPISSYTDTYWDHKSINIDSIYLKNRQQITELDKIITNLSNKSGDKLDGYSPQFAIVRYYDNKNDTLYFGEKFESVYFHKQERIVIDNENLLYKFMVNNFNDFIEKDHLEEKLKEMESTN